MLDGVSRGVRGRVAFSLFVRFVRAYIPLTRIEAPPRLPLDMVTEVAQIGGGGGGLKAASDGRINTS